LQNEKDKHSDFEFFISSSIDQINYIRSISQNNFLANEKLYFNVSMSEKDDDIVSKIVENSIPLKELCDAYFGIQTFDRNKFVSNSQINKNYKPIIDGTNIEPYSLKEVIEYVNFIPNAIKSGGKEFIYLKDRICIRQIGKTPIATYVNSGIFTLNTIYNVYVRDNKKINLKYVLGILNSKLLKFYWINKNFDHKETFPKVKKESILGIPIKNINKNNIQLHDKLVQLVELMLQAKQQLQTSKIEREKTMLEQKCSNLDKQIDELVYELYGLTEDEISIIENN